MLWQCERKIAIGFKNNYFNYIGEFIHTYVVLENIPLSNKTPKKNKKNSTFTQSNSIRAVVDIF